MLVKSRGGLDEERSGGTQKNMRIILGFCFMFICIFGSA